MKSGRGGGHERISKVWEEVQGSSGGCPSVDVCWIPTHSTCTSIHASSKVTGQGGIQKTAPHPPTPTPPHTHTTTSTTIHAA